MRRPPMRRPPRMLHVTPQDPMFDSAAFEQPHLPPSDIDWTTALAGQHGNTDPIKTPLGDPTRWGAAENIHVVGPNPAATSQFLQVQTIDPYSRSWQIIGTVGAFQECWDLAAASFKLTMELTMGVGQGTLVHLFDIRAAINNAAAWYVTQNSNNKIVKPFILAGGIIGRNLNARMVVQFPGLGAAVAFDVSVAALITPLAAGSGI